MLTGDNVVLMQLSPDQLVTEIKREPDLETQGKLIAVVLGKYAKLRGEWTAILDNHTGGLEKARTGEYAQVLGCTPDYHSVVTASFHLVHTWPQSVVPYLEAQLCAINDVSRGTNLFRAIEWEQLSRSYVFNMHQTMEIVATIEDLNGQIAVLELIRERVLENGRKGTLIIIDPESGDQMIPGERSYGELIQTVLKDSLDKELEERKLQSYLADARNKRNPKHPRGEHGAIVWSKQPRVLAKLLEDLRMEHQIECEANRLAALAASHFVDWFDCEFGDDELVPHFQVPQDPSRSEGPIVWAGTHASLVWVIVSLVKHGFIIATAEKDYGNLILTHFVDKERRQFEKKPLTVAKSRASTATKGSKTTEIAERVLLRALALNRQLEPSVRCRYWLSSVVRGEPVQRCQRFPNGQS